MMQKKVSQHLVLSAFVTLMASPLFYGVGCGSDARYQDDIKGYGTCDPKSGNCASTSSGSSSSSSSSNGTGGAGGGLNTCSGEGDPCTYPGLPSCTAAFCKDSQCIPDGDRSKARGNLCNDNGGAVCDSSGNCVGQDCKNGKSCPAGAFCVEGYCCESTCDGDKCTTCGLPGKAGLCEPSQKGTEDLLGMNDCKGMNKVCDGSKMCVDASGLLKLGEPCGNAGAGGGGGGPGCYYGECAFGTCRLNKGDPCDSNVMCVTNYCDLTNHVCADCPSPPCKSHLGELCGALDDCDGAMVCWKTAPDSPVGICKLQINAPCTAMTASDCISNYCNKTSLKCDFCAASPSNTCGTLTCSDLGAGSYCLLPDGEYCTAKEQCNSGKCDGFPARCHQ